MATSSSSSSSSSCSSSSSSMMRVKLDDTKAGMKGLDKDKINKIILDASKGSKFYQNEQRREAELSAKIRATLENLRRLPDSEFAKALKNADAIFEAAEASRDLTRTIVHVDMDCFFAAVHMRDDPSLKKVPMAVGGIGMLSTSNYLARRFGVRAAMPGFIAKKLCPELVIVPSDYPKYNEVAVVVRSVLAEYDPEFESGGCDEAYLDFTQHLVERGSTPEPKELIVSPDNESMAGCCRCDGTEKPTNELTIVDRRKSLLCDSCEMTRPGIFRFDNSVADAVEEMRLKIFLKTKLTASAGIAPNAPLAKISSDQNKPNGQFILNFDRESILDFVKELPVRKWPFIGKVQEKMLHGLEVFKLGQVYDKRAELLLTATSDGSFEYYVQASLGVGRNRVSGNEGERKSISNETTFSTMTDHDEMLKLLRELCDELSKDVESKGYIGKTITLKLKNDDFKVITRATTIGFRTREADQMFRVTSALLKTELKKNPNLRLRLMGVRLSQLEESNKKSDSGLHKFLGTSKSEKDKNASSTKPDLTCPICGVFRTKSLDALNSHVDSCLLGSVGDKTSCLAEIQSDDVLDSKPEEPESKPPQNNKTSAQCGLRTTTREIDSDEDLFDSDSECSDVVSAGGQHISDDENTCGFFATKLATLANDCSTPPPPPPTSVAESTTSELSERLSFTCPVCDRNISGDLSCFNRHLDLCVDLPCAASVPKTSNVTSSDSFNGRKRKSKDSNHREKEKIRRIDSFFNKS